VGGFARYLVLLTVILSVGCGSGSGTSVGTPVTDVEFRIKENEKSYPFKVRGHILGFELSLLVGRSNVTLIGSEGNRNLMEPGNLVNDDLPVGYYHPRLSMVLSGQDGLGHQFLPSIIFILFNREIYSSSETIKIPLDSADGTGPFAITHSGTILLDFKHIWEGIDESFDWNTLFQYLQDTPGIFEFIPDEDQSSSENIDPVVGGAND